MGAIFAKVINLGGFLNGSKTWLGVIAVIYYAVTTFKPEWKPLADEIIKALGLALLPIGLVDKAVKTKQ